MRPVAPACRAADDPLVAALRDSGAGVVTLVAKSHDRHVELALRTTLEENLAMIRDTVTHLREEGQEVFLDAEHFFDGYRANRDYALEVLRTAYDAGASVIALCDTNGGMLPGWVSDVVHDVIEASGVRVGIHCHNDTGCAVANTLAAVDAGATHVQGTINGYGERTGNADLVSVVANLELKLDRRVLPEGLLRDATRIAHAVAEVTNFPPASRQPYVGTSAFTHKAGLHASAIKVDPDLYQHMDPVGVGNDMRLLVSDMAGRASIELKGRELGFDLSGDRELVKRITDRVKDLESRGFTFEAADASFELLLVEEVEGARPSYFEVESWRVITETDPGDEAVSEATVKLRARGALRRDRRGQRSRQRARPGAADRDRAGLPRGREVRADRLQGADPRPGSRYRRDHPGADRDHRRRVVVGHGRGRPQRDRGVLARAGRRCHLRAAPPAGLIPARPVVGPEVSTRPRLAARTARPPGPSVGGREARTSSCGPWVRWSSSERQRAVSSR